MIPEINGKENFSAGIVDILLKEFDTAESTILVSNLQIVFYRFVN